MLTPLVFPVSKSVKQNLQFLTTFYSLLQQLSTSASPNNEQNSPDGQKPYQRMKTHLTGLHSPDGLKHSLKLKAQAFTVYGELSSHRMELLYKNSQTFTTIFYLTDMNSPDGQMPY
jgi:hypothetical protein